MAKLPKSVKPKRSHFKTTKDYERALWAYACDVKKMGLWMNYLKTRDVPRGKIKRKQRRHDTLVYGMLLHGGFGKVAMYQQ